MFEGELNMSFKRSYYIMIVFCDLPLYYFLFSICIAWCFVLIVCMSERRGGFTWHYGLNLNVRVYRTLLAFSSQTSNRF